MAKQSLKRINEDVANNLLSGLDRAEKLPTTAMVKGIFYAILPHANPADVLLSLTGVHEKSKGKQRREIEALFSEISADLAGRSPDKVARAIKTLQSDIYSHEFRRNPDGKGYSIRENIPIGPLSTLTHHYVAFLKEGNKEGAKSIAEYFSRESRKYVNRMPKAAQAVVKKLNKAHPTISIRPASTNNGYVIEPKPEAAKRAP